MGFVFLLSLFLGLALLVVGAEGFVRGAANLAAVIGLSPLIIGLTVVSYGTGVPELALNNLRLVIQPLISFNLIKPWLNVFSIPELSLGFSTLITIMNLSFIQQRPHL